jgi:DNA-binding CsgD family transcriptional regulator
MHNIPDISGDLVIQRFRQGIQLVNPDKMDLFQKPITVERMASMPFHVYFMNTKSVVQKLNERTAISFNLLSTTDAIGITVRDVAKKTSAERSLMVDRAVVETNAMLVKDELYTRLDDISFPMLSMKFPWYDIQHKLIGIFGFSIMIDKKWGCSLADSMTMLMQTGLLQTSCLRNGLLPGLVCDDIYFTKRQKDILQQIIKGKTARETAIILGLSRRTIESHIENMKQKTHSLSKSELIEKVINQYL